MRAIWSMVPLLLATACGSQQGADQALSSAGTTTTQDAPITAPVPTTTTTTIAPGPVVQQVNVEVTLPVFDGPATLWRAPALPADQDRLARWGRAFGFTEQEIDAASGGRIARDTPDGQVLTIYESTGHWVFVNGPAGMFADPPPSGAPDAAAAEARTRSLWQTLGIDVTSASVTVGGDENLTEVDASDNLDGIVVARLRLVIGADGRVLRATGSLDPPVVAGTVQRVALVDALDRFAREPPSGGPGTSAPASFDGVYRVIGASAGLTTSGEQWLIPTYEVSLADGRTITLLAIDPSDIPTN